MRDERRVPSRAHPARAVWVVVGVTSFVTALQLVSPDVAATLRRRPGTVANGQVWRLVTPLLVHPDGWWEYAFDIVGVALVGVLVERRVGAARFVALYLAGGIAGEIAGIAWDPHGGGASVGMCGLVGGLVVLLLGRRAPARSIPVLYALYMVAALAGAAVAGVAGSVVAVAVVAVAFGAAAARPGEADGIRTARLVASILLAATLVLLGARNIHGAALAAGLVAAVTIPGVRAAA